MADPFLWGAEFPLPSSTAESLLHDADPALYWMLAFWAAVLEGQLTPRIAAEQGRTEPKLPMARAVKSVLPYDPGPFLTESQSFQPPALAAYRVSSVISERTLSWKQAVSEWDVAYYLPSLAAGPAQRLLPLLHAVSRVLTFATDKGHDSSFEGGANVLGPDYANVARVRFTSHQYGRVVEDASGVKYLAWVGRCQVTERVMPLASAPPNPVTFAASVGQPTTASPATTPDDVELQFPLP
jgi:hypothetical protein